MFDDVRINFFPFLEIISGPDAKKKMGKFLKVNKQNFELKSSQS